jgi:uridine kinase
MARRRTQIDFIMLGDKITIRVDYYKTSGQIAAFLSSLSLWQMTKLVIAIAGESGSGKSVTALCLKKSLEDSGRKVVVLHLDDYFILPPLTNHQARLENITAVGPQEVHLDLLQQHVDDFRKQEKYIERPIVDYRQNRFDNHPLILDKFDCLIVEGTYSFFLKNIDFRVFLDRTYIETKQQRDARGRDSQDPFVEKVLAIEHEIIRPAIALADMVLDKNYKLIY